MTYRNIVEGMDKLTWEIAKWTAFTMVLSLPVMFVYLVYKIASMAFAR